jgi:hypothetical protein
MATYDLSCPPKELITHVKDLVINSFEPTVTFSHGPPKESTEATSKIYFFLAS